MPAIDFAELLKREKGKRRTKKTTKPQANEERNDRVDPPTGRVNGPALVPKWLGQASVLKFSRLQLGRISSNPKSIYYSPTLLNETSELQEWLENLPHGDSGLEEWKTMVYGKRRVAMFGEQNMDLPPPLNLLAEELVRCGIFPQEQAPNHVLLNEYQPSQGILPHTDGPLYESRTATLSLGSDVVLEFTKRLVASEIGSDAASTTGVSTPIQVLLEAGSLVVFEDDAYLHYCHGIAVDTWQDVTSAQCLNATPDRSVPRGRRFSLTFRRKRNQQDVNP